MPLIGWFGGPAGISSGCLFLNPLSAIICKPGGSGGICKCLHKNRTENLELNRFQNENSIEVCDD